MLYGYLSIARAFTENSFTGAVDQILLIVFTSLLYFYICLSAPALPHSLLTGTPNLSAAGAIRTVASAAGAVAGAASIGANIAGAGVRGALAGSGAVTQGAGAASEAAEAVRNEGGSRRAQIATGMQAFGQSMGGQAGEAVKDNADDFMRSLINRGGSHGTGSSGTAPNPHDIRQQLVNPDGSRKSFKDFYNERYTKGREEGRETGNAAAHEIAVDRMDEYQAREKK
jgi:type IV secretory pathway TrbL component